MTVAASGERWTEPSHYRPPLAAAAVVFTVQGWALVDNTIEIWPHYGMGWFWPTVTFLMAAVCGIVAVNPTPRSRWIAATVITAVMIGRSIVVFAAFGSDVAHIMAGYILTAFLAVYLFLDD